MNECMYELVVVFVVEQISVCPLAEYLLKSLVEFLVKSLVKFPVNSAVRIAKPRDHSKSSGR